MTGVVVQVGRRVVAWVVAAVVTVALVAGGLLVARGGLDRSPAVLPALDLGATGAVAADSTAAAGGAEPAPAGGGGVAPARPTDASSVPRLWPSVTYRLAGPLPALPDRARAWRVADDPGSGRVAALAAGLGLAGRPREEAGGWTVKDGNRVLSVNRQAGAPFGFTGGGVVAACAGGVAGRPYPEMGMQCLDPDSPVSNTPGTVTGGGGSTGGAPGGGGGSLGTGGSGRGGGGGSLGSAGSAGSSPGGVGGGAPVPPAPTPKAPARPVPPATTPKAPERPVPRPELPSREEAERVARELAAKAGLDLQGAAVHVSDGYAVRVVTIAPAVGGLPTSGFGWTVNVGAKGRVLFATGYLGTPEAADTYPLIGVEAGFERLKRTPARPVPLMERPGIEPAIAPNPCLGTKVPCTAKPLPARVATVTGVRLGLQLAPVVADGSRPAGKAFLLPAYLFELKGGWTDLRAVIAVQDRYLTKP